jgi:hypothetical protein
VAVRPPRQYAQSARGGPIDTLSPLDHEILGEKAAALGRAGEKVAHAVYAYFIQRELCGMKRHREIIREYAIPDEVLVRLGAS